MDLLPLALPYQAGQWFLGSDAQLVQFLGSVYYSEDGLEHARYQAPAGQPQIASVPFFEKNFKPVFPDALAALLVQNKLTNEVGMSSQSLPRLPHDTFQLMRHTDGGLYRYIEVLNHAEVNVPLVLYRHVWPFTIADWVRPLEQFTKKFIPQEESVLAAAVTKGQSACQKEISQYKAARRRTE